MSTESSTVKPIDKTSVHKICSGQVILTLSTAIKELIENSLDAGAKNIDIKVKGFGEENIEVSDSGSGIQPENFEAIALKHHTSKLKEFSDLIDVETFGFRGEALSSLSALSDLSIVTRHISCENGTKIDFDHSGKILNQTPCARQVGTTITLKNLFKTLPVRHKEFVKNVKREFTKMCQVLYSYCLIRPDVKFNCTNTTSNNKKTAVVNTTGKQDFMGVVTNIFGHQQIKSLKSFIQKQPSKEILEEFGLSEDFTCSFNISGYISVCEHGQGRSTTDRQFYFINKRPCDNSKLCRVVNEVYHQYNRHQYPFVFLDISFNKESVDVNVTPDKRQIFVQNEKLLLATIKTSLSRMYDNSSADLCTSLQSQVKVVDDMFKAKVLNNSTSSEISFNKLKRAFCPKEDTSLKKLPPKQLKLDAFSQLKSPTLSPMKSQETSTQSEINYFGTSRKFFNKSSSVISSNQSAGSIPCRAEVASTDNCSLLNTVANKDLTLIDRNHESKHSDDEMKVPDKRQEMVDDQSQIVYNNLDCVPQVKCDDKKSVAVVDEAEEISRRSVKVSVNLKKIAALCERQEKQKDELKNAEASRFRAKITPEDSKKAEDELKKSIGKGMFAEMEILFQFNLGFIIAKLKSDLFIIDQHASDEKYNFEMLQRNANIQTQQLIQPQALNLTVVNESILHDNLDIFRKNGFEFNFDENDKTSLTRVPVNRNWTFGKEDIDELIFMLSDSPGVMCRPSRVQQMFASQACRKSIMIGTGLTRANMKKLICHMGEIEQPWNCPHGRPTIRHLVNLDLIHS